MRQLKDTWPVECSCIYQYQLATQLDSQQDSCFHPFCASLFAARNSEVKLWALYQRGYAAGSVDFGLSSDNLTNRAILRAVNARE
jgi:hypothetical protein